MDMRQEKYIKCTYNLRKIIEKAFKNHNEMVFESLCHFISLFCFVHRQDFIQCSCAFERARQKYGKDSPTGAADEKR